jgi:anaerobic ribonucleoside-triphosphate reductase activating protein
MLRLYSYEIVFREVPEEISLALNLSECPHHCDGCHSPWLWGNEGMELTIEKIDELLSLPKHKAVTCLCFMGGDNDPKAVIEMNKLVKEHDPIIKTCWYTGYTYAELEHIGCSHKIFEFDYVKIGPYIKELGPIDKEGSNQVMFMRTSHVSMKNITSKFRKNWTKTPAPEMAAGIS